MADFRNEFYRTTDTIPVSDETIHSLLRSIIESNKQVLRDSKTNANNSAKLSRDTQSKLDNLLDQNKQDSENSRVESLAKQRNDRATWNALHSEIKKGFSIKDAVLDGLKKLGDIFKEGILNSVRSIDNLTRQLTQDKYSYKEIGNIGYRVSESLLSASNKYGLGFSREQVGAYAKEFADRYGTASLNALDPERFVHFMMAREQGIGIDVANSVASSTSDILSSSFNDFLKLPKSFQDQYREMFSNFSETTRSFANKDQDLINRVNSNYVTLVQGIGQIASPEAIRTIMSALTKLEVNDVGSLTEEEKTLTASLGLDRSAGSLSKNIEIIKSGFQTGRFLSQANVLPEEIKAAINNAAAIQDPNQFGLTLRSDSDVDLIKSNYSGEGKLQNFFTQLVAGADVAFGGALSEVSAIMQHMLGPDQGIEKIVSNGFSFVINLLTAIVASDFIKKGFGGLPPILDFFTGKNSEAAGAATKAGTAASTAGNVASNNALKSAGSKLASVNKALGKIALPITIAAATIGSSIEIYDEVNKDYKKFTSDLNSESTKAFERQQQAEIKAAKITGSVVKGSVAIGGAVAGAKIGAAIGTVAPGVGNVIGAVAGAAIGGAGAIIADKVTGAIESNKTTETLSNSIKDLENQVENYEKALKSQDLDPKLKENFEKSLKETKEALNNNTQALAKQLSDKFVDKNSEFYENNTSAALQALSEQLNKTLKENSNNLSEIAEKQKLLSTTTDQSDIDLLNDEIAKKWTTDKENAEKIKKTYEAITFALLHNEGMETGESIDDFIKRLSDDARGGFFNFTDNEALDFASRGAEGVEQAARKSILEGFKSGVFDETLDLVKNMDLSSDQQMKILVDQITSIANDRLIVNNDTIGSLLKDVIKLADKTEEFNKYLEDNSANTNNVLSQFTSLQKFASGGLINSPTLAVVGEAGREAVLPLTDYNSLSSVIDRMSSEDKLRILSAMYNDSALADQLAEQSKLMDTSSIKSRQFTNSSTPSDIKEIINELTYITKYLKDIASSPNIKRNTFIPVSKPVAASF